MIGAMALGIMWRRIIQKLPAPIERAASTDPAKVRDAMAKTNLTKGPGSVMPGCHIEFDDKGWNKHVHPVMTQWQKGQLRTVYPSSDARVSSARALSSSTLPGPI